MRKYINMHIHTSASDGEYDIRELYQMIKKTDLKTISITDHDTIDAYKTLKEMNVHHINIINGCEFSSKPIIDTYGSRLHILGYDMDLQNQYLLYLLSQKRRNNYHNFFLLLEELKTDYNIHFSKEEIDKIFKKKDFGRPDIALLLIKHRYVKNMDEAFSKYLIPVFEKTKPFRKCFSPEEIFDVIKNAGGCISIAHIISNKFNENQLDHFLNYIKNKNVDAIELYHPSHNSSYRKYLLEKIKKYDFLISGGTDYHGPNVKPERLLECNTNDHIKIKKLSLCDYIVNKKNQ